MAKFIADEGLKSTVRSLRRTQSLQMLKTFFKNHHLFAQNEKQALKYSGKVCEYLKTYAAEVDAIPQSEFLEIIQFIIALRNQKYFTIKEELLEFIQKQRLHLYLKPSILSVYKSFCNVMKIPLVSNEQIPAIDHGTSETANGINGAINQKKKENGTAKRKRPSSKKEKKLRKQQRFEIASKGFNGNFSFSAAKEVMLD